MILMNREGRMKFKAIGIIVIIGFLIVELSFPAVCSEITKSLLFPEYSRRISMDFKDASLKDVLKIFSQQSGLNFIASEDVEDRMVTMYLDKVPVEEALEQLLSANRLKYEIQKGTNIFIVSPVEEPEVRTITKIYFLKYASVSGSKITSEIASGLASESDSTEGGDSSGGTETSSSSTAISTIINGLLSDYGSVYEDARTNSLIITDLPSRFPLIEDTIARLDIPVPQVLIEVEMLDVSKDLVDKLGVEWSEDIVRWDATTLSKIVDFPFGRNKGANPQSWTMEHTGATDGGWNVSAWPAAHYGPTMFTLVGTEVALDLLRTQTDTKYLARPRILTLSNETAEIKISASEAIGQLTVTSSSEGTSTTSVEAERFDTGVILRVTPQVNMSTGEITMYLDPKVVEIKTGRVFGGTTFYDPETRGTKSVVRVLDGETIVIGGLMKTQKGEVETKVPFLGDIPLIGALFRHKYKSKDEQRELIIFITPRIVKESLPVRSMVANTGLDREQDFPAARIDLINEALTDIERKRR
jgi:type IV pilus assembly protein PilQ